jgi:hypothetical protein
MVTITHDSLDGLVHNVAYEIEKTTGLNKDTMLNLFTLNDTLTEYLNGYGVQYEDELPEEMDPKMEAINNIKQALRVIAPVWESMARFGHSGAADVAGAQADLEQAVRFLTGEEEPS